MSNEDVYVNYTPEPPPAIVPRTKKRFQTRLKPAASCLDLHTDITLDHAVNPAQIGFKTAKGLNAEHDEAFEAGCHHFDAKIPSKPKLTSAGMFHAQSVPNLSNVTDEIDFGTKIPKKKKKGLHRFINFLRKIKKGKEQFDKIIHHPIMEELGVPELLDGAKDMAIDAVRSQIGI